MRQFIFTVTILFICSISFAQLSLSSTQQNVTCNGVCDGSATITVTGGTAPYTYAWTPTNITSPNPSGLCAGAYTVTVTDALSITASLIVTITQPPALVSSIGSITNVSCFGACNGSANIMVSGGTGGYTYIWNTVPNQILPTATNLCVGSFNAIVTDANGCVTASSITISQPTQITLNVIKTNASCNGTCNGTATITTMGGTPAYTFTSQPSGITTGVNSNLCAGSYTFTIQDSQACLVTNTFTISPNGGTSLPNATLTTTPYNETCYLTGDGAIDLTITGTNPGPFTYLWSNGATTQDISNVISNTYWVTISVI